MGERFSYKFAVKEYEKLSAYLEKGRFKHDASGSLRRKKEDVGDIDIVIMGDKKKILEYISKYVEVEYRINEYEFMLLSGIAVHVIPEIEAEYKYTLWHSTGPKPHVKYVEDMYMNKNKKINKKFKNEKDLYEAIGLEYLKPEERYQLV